MGASMTGIPEVGGDGGLGVAQLVQLANAASKKVPAVKFAFGLAGIAACGALISLILGTTKGGLFLLALTFLGSILLFLFAKLSTSSNQQIYTAGLVLIWAVVGFFTFFLTITTTAFVAEWPQPWAEFLGVSTNSALCNQRVQVMWTQFFNPDIQYNDALATAEQVAKCAPFQSLTVKGAVAFYTGDYVTAVQEFERAHKIIPTDDPITRNLGDSYVEVGRLDDAIMTYNMISKKDALWNYKMARVKYYKGSLADALSIVQEVPSDLFEDGGLLGRPRVLQAAILVERSKIEGQTISSNTIIEAHEQFEQGIQLDRTQWENILRITQRTKHETFKRQVVSLKPYLTSWLANVP
jgi:hypothetical protein